MGKGVLYIDSCCSRGVSEYLSLRILSLFMETYMRSVVNYAWAIVWEVICYSAPAPHQLKARAWGWV